MKKELHPNDRNLHLGLTGILYLIVIVGGLFSELGVRGALFLPENLFQTMENIQGNQSLLKLGVASDMVMFLADIGLAWFFLILFQQNFPRLSYLAAFFRLVQAGIIGINLIHLLQIPALFQFFPETKDAQWIAQQIGYLIESHRMGYLLSGIPFGMSCILLGYMMYQSGWFSRLLGAMVLIAGFSYLIDSFTNILFPEYSPKSEILVMAIAVITELSLCIYLIIKGIKKY
ncbi:DUF4386 domain-containing protein [Algoriphagus sp. CAU 1675]|uniref:DUF4386 domain-containing protein n=1 Tax=Algoriphagus sp. CAU 1675 TaxID=3032597 RepID=UPI0023DA0D6D|nr:DUF4386 domain-containing protein [Algoriphagus sp. CAU 1675]MDF2157112.1 DUF4386 domain-containing protein [Algoriphagus sp. CAU 1675]